jgi:hypothetical protein
MDKQTFDKGVALKTGNKIFYYESHFFDIGEVGISVDDGLHRPFDYFDYLKCDKVHYQIFYKDPDFDSKHFSPEVPVDILQKLGIQYSGDIVERHEFWRVFLALNHLYAPDKLYWADNEKAKKQVSSDLVDITLPDKTTALYHLPVEEGKIQDY